MLCHFSDPETPFHSSPPARVVAMVSTSSVSARVMKRRRSIARKLIARACACALVVEFAIGVFGRTRPDAARRDLEGPSRWSITQRLEWSQAPPSKPKCGETTRNTPFGNDGGPMEYGNAHRMMCGNNAALTGFRFEVNNDDETKVRNAYTCVRTCFDDEGSSGKYTALTHWLQSKETEHTATGTKWRRRDSLNLLGAHEVDCMDRFISSWYLKQWSKSMSIVYECTSGKRMHRWGECETLQSPKVELDVTKISSLVPANVSCYEGSALTRFRFIGHAFEFTCCSTSQLTHD